MAGVFIGSLESQRNLKIERVDMEKEIINRGYLTHALTDETGLIYGINPVHWINWRLREGKHRYYWSDVFCDGPKFHIIRKGILLANATPEELEEKFEQSKINLAIL